MIRPWTPFQLAVPFLGAVVGASVCLNRLARGASSLNNWPLFAQVAVGALLGAVLFSLSEIIILAAVRRWLLPGAAMCRFRRLHAFGYLIFGTFALGSFGFRVDTDACIIAVIASFIAVTGALLPLSLDVPARAKLFSSLSWLAVLFFISGIAALIYQVTWERVLFGAFGVNIESVTLVVVIFMFGLGLGSLVGGLLSKRYPRNLPLLFLLCESLTGLFGVVSLPLIRFVGARTIHHGTFGIGLSIFALLTVPTLLMGATLPILVTHLYAHYRHAGKAVGLLYFVNTLGSAAACFLAADVLFVLAGQQLSVLFAAICNLTVGVLVWKHTRAVPQTKTMSTLDSALVETSQQTPRQPIGFAVALILAALIGYVSLSQEILWFHGLSFSTGGAPKVFAHVLGLFLLGIAVGSLYAKKKTETSAGYPGAFLARALLTSGIIYFAATPVAAWAFLHGGSLGFRWIYFSVFGVALLSGLTFPILCHFSASARRGIGVSISWLYFANIIGSMLGPIITTYVLMDILTLSQLNLYASLLTFTCAGLVALLTPVGKHARLATLSAILLATGVVLALQPFVSIDLIRRLQFKNQSSVHAPYERVIENRSGIITTEANATGTIIYGDGTYDGRFNVDPIIDSNLISRCFMISALHRSPRKVLEIGLSSGSWTRVLADYGRIKSLDVVEINPGYREAVATSENALTLVDPKTTIHVDDGRRWLNRHPEATFDLIVMNTSYYWRSQITNLLSREFLLKARAHLNPGGVIYYNTTGLPDIAHTAASVFPHIVTIINFVAASDVPFDLTKAERTANLMEFSEQGRLIFEGSPGLAKRAQELVQWEIRDLGPELRQRKELWLITDDNMASEFRAGLRFYEPEKGWRTLFSP